MRITAALMSMFVVLVFADSVRAELELPRLSPLARVSQRVGLTDIEVEYGSPGVKGREIWGGLVPYDKLWRTGANAATKVSFSRDVLVAGKEVPAGTYAIFTLPTKKTWTVILNKNPNQGGTGSYDKALDQLRFQAKPKANPFRERMTFVFADHTDLKASLDLEWEKLKVSIPILVDTVAAAEANIDKALDDTWRIHASAARYMLDDAKNYTKALAMIDTSLQLHSDWYNNWLKAAILAAKGDYKTAYPYAKKAKALGDKAKYFFWRARVEKALKEWKAKL